MQLYTQLWSFFASVVLGVFTLILFICLVVFNKLICCFSWLFVLSPCLQTDSHPSLCTVLFRVALHDGGIMFVVLKRDLMFMSVLTVVLTIPLWKHIDLSQVCFG